jgi:type IV pilus assembly protein PilX
MKARTQTNVKARQAGATLVVALLMLLVLTVLGLASLQVTRMEERMAGNSRDVNLAFQGAEAGLRDAEEGIRVLTARPTTCVAAPCSVWREDFLPPDLRDQGFTWWAPRAREYGIAGTHEVTEVTRDPRVLVEDMGFVADSLAVGHGPPEGRNFYRVTANSSGASDTAEAILESTYTRRY